MYFSLSETVSSGSNLMRPAVSSDLDTPVYVHLCQSTTVQHEARSSPSSHADPSRGVVLYQRGYLTTDSHMRVTVDKHRLPISM